MEMQVMRGRKADGTYRQSEFLRYPGIELCNVIEMLSEAYARYKEGIGHFGTEISAIKVQSWIKMINSSDDIREMLDYYKGYMEKEGD